MELQWDYTWKEIEPAKIMRSPTHWNSARCWLSTNDSPQCGSGRILSIHRQIHLHAIRLKLTGGHCTKRSGINQLCWHRDGLACEASKGTSPLRPADDSWSDVFIGVCCPWVHLLLPVNLITSSHLLKLLLDPIPSQILENIDRI